MQPSIPTYERGEANPRSKLSESSVLESLRLRERGHSYRQIAEHFRVSPSCIHALCRGRTWKWLTSIGAEQAPRSGRRRVSSSWGQLTLF